MTPRPHRVFTEKPRIEDYADYNAFLVDIMEYRRQKDARLSSGMPAPEPASPAATLPADSPVVDRSLYEIKRPETLEEALARARKLPHPVYTEPERFGRTTSFSFPIPPMEGDDMSSNDVPGQLADPNAAEPEGYQDSGALENTDSFLASKPTNDKEARDAKAQTGTDDAYRVSFDTTTRIMSDSDGNHFWMPIIIPGEIGDTVVRRFDVEVSTFRN